MVMVRQPSVTDLQEKVLRGREFSGLRLQERVYFSNLGSLPHAHPDTIFCIVLQGGCTEDYGGKTRQYRLFDSEFLPPGHEHSLKFHAPKTPPPGLTRRLENWTPTLRKSTAVRKGRKHRKK